MFDSIRGRLTHVEPMRTVVEAGGIGYEIQIPLSTYEVLPKVGEEAKLLLHPVVRETEWRLFGFHSVGEREVFRALLRVTGVGPTLALSLLSGLDPAAFRDAVAEGDVKELTRVKGIGRKTAERIVVELKDVVTKELSGVEPSPGRAIGVAGKTVEDAVRALVALGLQTAEARRRVEKHLGDAGEGETPELADLVRRALRG